MANEKTFGEEFARRWYELTQECSAADVTERTCCYLYG